MLYLLESDTRNVKWNGIPLHEATSAIIKEQMNGDFTLTVRYPITDSEIYQLFREDMLIKAPAPVIGPQLFRIKKPVENDDHLEITAYHITDDVMQRSINPLSVNKQSCWQALSQLVQVAKSPINDFSFTSDITDRRTINTKEVETLYSVLMDGAHSIVGTWEGEMVRDNFAISIKRNRGEDRGVIISTHKNLKSYQRTKNSQNVVTRIHAKSTFKAEGAKEDTTIAITVDSPLIGAYPYINERSYTNNNIQTVEELTKWASAKFTNEHIDKATDAIKIEAYELDGQTVHMGDTVNLKSYKHNVDVYKKAIAYEYDCLANNGQGAYLTITFDDKVKSGGNGGGMSAVANAILDKQETQFDIMLERAIANADRAFDAEFAKREKAITDGIELAKAKAEEVKQELSDTINQRFNSFDNGSLKEAKRKAEEALKNAGVSSSLAQEAKQIGERARADITNLQTFSQNALRQIETFKTQYGTKLNEIKSTADGLFTKMGAVETYISKDGQRQESLKRYARDESARQVSVVREQISRDYVGKSAYQEDVKGLERRFSAISTQTSNNIATKIAQYKQTVDGQFASITSQIAGKVNQTDFQRVRETSQLYERIIGRNENDISNKVARMALTNQLFQVEVSKNEGLKTVQRQIAGSWAVQNLTSAGALISGLNLGANGYNRLSGKLTHITGETLIDKAVIKSAMVDKLKTANFEAGSVTTVVLDAEAVTAEKIKVDQALFNKLVANEAYLNQLFAKQAFINRVQSVAIDASQVRSGILSGDRIYGGTIRGANIFGGTLTGHTKIQLGSYGSFDTVNGGLQINIPRYYNAKDGLGVQFIGSSGRGENVPYGLFIYKDSDFTVGGTAETSDSFLLTVEGYIQAKGIGWLKTGKGSVNGKTTGTIGFWNSGNVSLSFGGSGNDIYYSYNNTAYSLWSVVNKHFSDRRLKENIIDCEHKALDYIHQFQFKEYDWKKQEDRPQQAHTKIGLIAQEVQAVDPTLVYENGDTLNLDNLRLTNIALKAIQELALENRKLTYRLENLENEYRTA